MKTSDYYYELPKELIAQVPIEPRDSSRLMILHKNTGSLEHKIFRNIIDYLNKGDCLVINDTRVIPARIYGVKEKTGAIVEFLLVSQKENDVWECLCKPGKRAKIGTIFDFGNGLMKGEVIDVNAEGNRFVRFSAKDTIYSVLSEIGTMPLPPYIKEKLKNQERYQTVYSDKLGSAAAPTAGLHFTEELLKKIKDKGINIAKLTLHVGLGTFKPVNEEDITKHKMHTEHYILPAKSAEIINNSKKNGGKIISVGTTSCRTLETVMGKYGKIIPCEGDTSIFIYPGYQFKCIDSLITNFHLPESTLIMLVSAFAGYDNIMNAYKIAVKEHYRFFSFGDAMLIED